MGEASISSLNPSWTQIIHIAVILLICLIVTPIMIYWTSKIYRRRSTIIMQKRYIGLSILSCCLSILWIFCGVPMFIWYRFLLRESSPMKLPVGVALSNLYPILGHGIMYTLLVRFFMLFFHQNWTRVTLSSHWIIHIRKPSSKDKEREKRLIALQQKQQREQEKQKEAVLQINSAKVSKKREDAKRQALKPHNYADDLQNGLNKMENSGNHLHPNPLNKTAPAQKTSSSELLHQINDDKTIAIHNDIKFPSQITSSWYIKNRPRYASHQRILRRAYPVLLIEICVVIFISVMAAYSHQSHESLWPNIQYITNFILWLIPSVTAIYLFIKLPSDVADSFAFKDEMRKLLIVNIITCVILFAELIVVILSIFIPIENSSIKLYISSVTNEVFVIFGCMANVYFQSEWLLARINSQIVKLDTDFFNEPYQYNANPHLAINSAYRETYSKTNTATNTGTASTLSPAFNIQVPNLEMPRIEENVVSNNNNNNAEAESCEIKQPESPGTDAPSVAYREASAEQYNDQMYRILFFTLQSYKLFNDFTSYLASELSMECSFAFIEFTQFQALMQRDMTFMQLVTAPTSAHYICDDSRASCSSSSTYSYNLVKLPRQISRSSIVHNKKYARMQAKFRYRKIAKKLSEKYLESGAEFELAISSARKKEVVQWVANHCRHLKAPRGSRNDYSNHSSNISTSNYSSQSEQSSKCSSKTSLSDQLYHLFEDCRKEIYYLMAHSCDRFVKTEAKKRDILKDHLNE